jgi:1-phosphofructokinase
VPDAGKVAVFGPNPLLTVTIESRPGAEADDDVHLHGGGQGVWVSRAAGELGAVPILCGFVGGESGRVLEALLQDLPGERRLVHTAAPSGCYVVDRRDGTRRLISRAWTGPPSRHEIDDLFSLTCAAALDSDVLVVCNPLPVDALPLEIYTDLVADVRAAGTRVMVDLSPPRLNHALDAGPDLVKLNDWELAELVVGPVDTPERLRAAAERVRERGAGTVVVTRGGEPGLVLHGDDAWELVPPRLDRGSREGCGDTMMGALAAAMSSGVGMERGLALGAGAGAANFLRHGLGTGSRAVIEELADRVELRPPAT